MAGWPLYLLGMGMVVYGLYLIATAGSAMSAQVRAPSPATEGHGGPLIDCQRVQSTTAGSATCAQVLPTEEEAAEAKAARWGLDDVDEGSADAVPVELHALPSTAPLPSSSDAAPDTAPELRVDDLIEDIEALPPEPTADGFRPVRVPPPPLQPRDRPKSKAASAAAAPAGPQRSLSLHAFARSESAKAVQDARLLRILRRGVACEAGVLRMQAGRGATAACMPSPTFQMLEYAFRVRAVESRFRDLLGPFRTKAAQAANITFDAVEPLGGKINGRSAPPANAQ